jgi:putative hydrolase of the HAD superfamily
VNVVFDIGGVVLAWHPTQVIAQEFDDPAMHDRIRAATSAHPEWQELDRGTMDLDEAVARGARRSGLTVPEMAQLIERLTESLTPISGALDLVRAVKASGNRIFVLSNMPSRAVEHIEQQFSFWDLFDGIVFSSRVHMVKPESQIYQHLLDTYHLVPKDTIFIDDTDINLEAARKLGIGAVKFENPQQCTAELRKLGCM